MKWDVCIVGCGPASLAFINTFSQKEKKILVIDSGKNLIERKKGLPEDFIQGEGGAGLWSDGKFSFYPSGKAVYFLNGIKAAYEKMRNMFVPFRVIFPDFIEPDSVEDEKEQTDHFVQKPYYSFYLSLEQREQFIAKLTEDSHATFLFNETVVGYEQKNEGIIVRLQSGTIIQCEKLILAGGRFGGLTISPSFEQGKKTWKRVEFGVRIEIPVRYTLFNGDAENLIDPKYIYRNEYGIEYRTFCVCRQGTVVDTCYNGDWACSGSSENKEISSIHNIGFNVRIRREILGRALLSQLAFIRQQKLRPFHHTTLTELELSEGPPHFGVEATQIIVEGIRKLGEQFPEFADPDTRFSGPTIEGIGYYPTIDPYTLQHEENVFVIGDATGIFRGTVPALLSGIVLAHYFDKKFSK